MPRLDERCGDFELLANLFLYKHNEAYGTEYAFSDSALSHMENMEWGGNVRQLENTIYLLATRMKKNTIELKDIRRYLVEQKNNIDPSTIQSDTETDGFISVKIPIEKGMNLRVVGNSFKSEAEKILITRTLKETGWNKYAAASILKVSYKTLLNRLEEYRISSPERFNAVKDEDEDTIISALKKHKGNKNKARIETGFSKEYFKAARIKFGIDPNSFK